MENPKASDSFLGKETVSQGCYQPQPRRYKAVLAAILTILLFCGLYQPATLANIPIVASTVNLKHQDGSTLHHAQSPEAPCDHQSLSASRTASLASHPSPTVVLDYCTIAPAAGDDSWGYYKYQNIRFAAPITPERRFKAPEPPLPEYEVNVGTLATRHVNCTDTEDCLFLDVYTPTNFVGQQLPVMVWVYGGGYYCCGKADLPPDGLFDLSKGFIYVAINHRTGFTGMMSGPSYSHQGGVGNTGLWDIEYGLRWVQKNIHHFGGDPKRVTGVAYSAGASLLMFTMTRFGGREPQLVQQVYLTSPGYSPGAGHHHSERFWMNVSSAVGCPGGSIDCIRQVDFNKLTHTARNVSNEHFYVFEPKVDGHYITDTFESLFYQNRFTFNGPMVLSTAYHEANIVARHGVHTEEDFRREIKRFFPSITEDVIENILDLYPLADYASQGFRFSDVRQYFDITAKTLAITRAMKNQTWNAKVALGGQDHGSDLDFYWYKTRELLPTATAAAITGPTPTQAPSNVDTRPPAQCPLQGTATILDGVFEPRPTIIRPYIARTMQKYLLSFVITGNPNRLWPEEKLYWPRYNTTPGGTEMVMNDTFHTVDTDVWANEKSEFWNKALWY